MSMTETVKGYGSAARFRAESAGHRIKDRMLERRLDRSSQEAERLRLENQLLRDEVAESRTEHHRILDLLEERMSEHQTENGHGNGNGRSHKGRWVLLLVALGGGAFAIVRRMRENGTAWGTGSSATA